MLRIGQAAAYLGVAKSTLRRWEKMSLITPMRTLGGHRRYTISLLDEIYTRGFPEYVDGDARVHTHTLCYARVSGHKQREKGDLDRQAQRLINTATDASGPEPIIIRDVGSGLNPYRPGLRKVLKLVASAKVSKIYVTYRDRLTRFGFPFIEAYCDLFGVRIIETEQISEKTVQQHLVDDMMSLIACFSGKLYGMRSAKQRRKNSLKRREKQALLAFLEKEESKGISTIVTRILAG